MNWKTENNKLTKTFEFPDFLSTLAFVNKVAEVAEELGHHPEIFFTWGKAIITTTTHDLDNKITEKDYILVDKIDKLS